MYGILRNMCIQSGQQSKTLISQQRFVKIHPSVQNTSVLNETFEEKNARLKRPLSPHLSIYKPQITSILSITHRLTGLALFGYAVGIAGCGYFGVTDDVVLYIRSLELSPPLWLSIKALIATPFTYHFANGIRHLVWDMGFALNNKGVNITGYGVLILTIIFALGLASLQ